MLISVNNQPNRQEFDILLNTTLNSLRTEAKAKPKKYLDLLGNKLENEVFDILKQNAKGSVFDGSIELISGQKFPDIIAKKYYGIEVKTTKSNIGNQLAVVLPKVQELMELKEFLCCLGKCVTQ
jgi:hypothetical protein